MDSTEQPIHIVIRLPYPRPEGFVDGQPMHWTEAMEKTLWQLIGQTKPSLVDWPAVSRQLGNVPVPFLLKHATFLYQNQLQDLHRIGEQQDLATQQQQHRPISRSSSRVAAGPGGFQTSVPITSTTSHPGMSSGVRDGNLGESSQTGDRDRTSQGQDSASRTQAASPSLSGSISTFPSTARPASMSSSASTIRPVRPPSPSQSHRNNASSQLDNHAVYNSGVLSNRGQTQPRSARGSQLISPLERRSNNLFGGMHHLPTSPRDEISLAEANRRISEPAHPFHHATLSASQQLLHSPSATKSSPSPGRLGDLGNNNQTAGTFSDNASSLSSASTPYSQSNSASQIFEETSFFNQLSSNDSLSRGQQLQQQQWSDTRDDSSARGAFQEPPFTNPYSAFGHGFVDNTRISSSRYDQQSLEHAGDNTEDDDDDDRGSEDKDGDETSADESGPLREQIKQLHLEDVLAFLPSTSASGILQRPSEEENLQRRTVSGEKMPFQLDDELANLGTRSLEEISEHDGGDEDEDLQAKGIRFKDQPHGHHHHHHHQHNPAHRIRGLGLSRDGDGSTKVTRTSPERSGPSSSKSSAQNSVGSSFSDLSDSSVTQSAMEDAYLSGFNNSKTSLFMHASTRN